MHDTPDTSPSGTRVPAGRRAGAPRWRELRRHAAWVVAIVLIAGCASSAPTIGPSRTGLEVEKPSKPAPESEQLVVGSSTPTVAQPGVTDIEIYEGTGVFIDEEAARKPPEPVAEDGEIVLNFEGESIQSVVHTILGEVLQETFVIGPGVSGEVTFSTSKPVSRDQLMPILELLLQWNGATLVYTEGRYHVLPVAEAIPGHLAPQIGGLQSAKGYEVRGVPLRYIAAVEMEKILQPYVRDGAIVQVDQFRSMIFLAGTPEELRNYLRTVEIFDVDWLEGMSVGIYPLRTVDVEAIIGELEGVFGTEGDTPLAGMFRFIPLERLGSVMVITYQQEYLHKAEEWIRILDRGAAGAGKQLYVYRVKNLEAPILAGYLTEIFGGEGGARNAQTDSGGTLAPGLEPVQVGSVSDFNESRLGSGSQTQAGGESGGGSVLSLGEGDIRITAVTETNSLLIQSTQSQYNSILAAIERIDIEPLQVLIESQVLNVELTEDLQFGVAWFLTNNPDLIPAGAGNPFGRYIDSISFGGGANNFLTEISRPINDGTSFVQATISALDAVTDVRSLAAPSLLVRNNATAAITVGTQVPVQSSSISTGTNNVVSSAQYVSTGTTLTVTPRINPGGLVYMDISQDVSRAGARDPDISLSGNPPINNQTVTSQVAVQSGQTVFLGGLISEQDSRGRSGVPFLNRVPIIGPLFGTRNKNTSRSETLVMITPTVIETSVDLERISSDLEKEFSRVPPLKISTLVEDKE
ncbi:type II secretion system secretin GspD [Elongatibacter sediminis]|uniref:Type II secretion system secretin GspD n=1 Tax=Elongatibacter sediminis TaxID=3119006 RepID=A0AAW9RJI9_9GAMM